MNNKRPQYTKSKFKMFSSCFIFYDNTGTLSLRLWFPNMPLLVLWLNIDFSIQAEAALNLGSCPHPPCKADALVWSWTAVTGLAPCPPAAWRGGEGSTSSSANLRSSEGTRRVLSLRRTREDTLTLHISWSKAQDSRAEEYKKETLQCTHTPATALNNKHINCFSWSAETWARCQYNTGSWEHPNTLHTIAATAQ